MSSVFFMLNTFSEFNQTFQFISWKIAISFTIILFFPSLDRFWYLPRVLFCCLHLFSWSYLAHESWNIFIYMETFLEKINSEIIYLSEDLQILQDFLFVHFLLCTWKFQLCYIYITRIYVTHKIFVFLPVTKSQYFYEFWSDFALAEYIMTY